MTDATPDAKAIFCDALEQPSDAERRAFLDRACGDDADLRTEVDALLEAHEQAGNFLRPPVPASTAVHDDHRFYYHVRNTVLMLRGGAWERREKLGLLVVLLSSSREYLGINRRRPSSALNLLRALADGLRTPLA